MAKPNKWEIWYAKVKFEDDPTKMKERPVLVVDERDAYIISLKITHHAPRDYYDGEYPIQQWSKAGLTTESTIRTSKVLKLVDSDFVRKIGRLQAGDVIFVRRLLQQQNIENPS